jgi:hypothetical protein
MKAESRRLNEEPYVGKLLVRFREGPGRRLLGLLDEKIRNHFRKKSVKKSLTPKRILNYIPEVKPIYAPL